MHPWVLQAVASLLTASWGGHGLLLALADVLTLTSAPVFAKIRAFRFCADA
jgi:hypothetical protein